MVVGQVGEDGHVEEDPVDPVGGQGVGRHLHGQRPAAVVTRPGQQASGAPGTPAWCGRRRGCRSPPWVGRLRLEDGRTRWVTVVLPLVPVTPTMVSDRADGRRRPRRRGPWPGAPCPRATTTWVTSRARTLDQSKRGGPGLATASAACWWPSVCATGETAEQGTGPDASAVEFDGSDQSRRRVATDTDRVDVVDHCGHLHEGTVQGLRGRARSPRPRSRPTYGPSVVAPEGTAVVPVAPTAELDVEVVAAAVVGMP